MSSLVCFLCDLCDLCDSSVWANFPLFSQHWNYHAGVSGSGSQLQTVSCEQLSLNKDVMSTDMPWLWALKSWASVPLLVTEAVETSALNTLLYSTQK